MYKSWQISSLVILSAVVLPGCTPAQTSGGTVEWVVANHTLDTLRVVVRYPLDSVLVPLAEVAARRHSLKIDSADHARQGYIHPSLARLTTHKGKWYWVRNSVGGIATWSTCDPLYIMDKRSRYQSRDVIYAKPPSSSNGTLTYQLLPHCVQLLAGAPFVPDSLWSPPPVIGLQLRQGSQQRVVLPGRPLLQVFRPQPTGREHDYSAQYRYQLTVGPGLTINE